MDDPAQPAPASGKEEFYLSKKDDVLLTPEQIAAEERRWLFEAPIAELAEVKGVSIDEAVKMRTDAVLQEAVVPITVSVRPIEPQGKLIGFASVNFGGVVIDDFKVVDGKNGIFLGAPSKPDPASRTGYRATVRIPDRAIQERINAAGVEAYHAAVEQLVARAQAVRPAPVSYTHLFYRGAKIRFPLILPLRESCWGVPSPNPCLLYTSVMDFISAGLSMNCKN